MISKTIKYHPIVVVDYAQWLVSASGRKEALEAQTLAGKLKDRVDELSATLSSTTTNTSELKTMVAEAKKVADQASSKVSALNK